MTRAPRARTALALAPVWLLLTTGCSGSGTAASPAIPPGGSGAAATPTPPAVAPPAQAATAAATSPSFFVREPFGISSHATPEGAVRGMLNALSEGGGDPTHANLPEWLDGPSYNDFLNELPVRFTLPPGPFKVTNVDIQSVGDSYLEADYSLRFCDMGTGRCTIWTPEATGNSGHTFKVRRTGTRWKVKVSREDSFGLDGAFGAARGGPREGPVSGRPAHPGPTADAVRLLQSTSADPSASASGDGVARDAVVLLRPGPPELLPAAEPARDRLLQRFEECVARVVGATGPARLDPLTVLTTTAAAAGADVVALVCLTWDGTPSALGTTVVAGTGVVGGRSAGTRAATP